MRSFISAFPFAVVVSVTQELLPVISQIPVLLAEDENVLCGHFAGANPHGKLLPCEAMILFSGEHDYISPGWFQEEKGVPTWNYSAAEIRGKMRVATDNEKRVDLLRMLNRFEPPDSRFRLLDFEDDFYGKLFRGITGFRMQIESWKFKQKLSQNKKPEVVRNIISSLNNPGLAADMEKVLKMPD